MRVRSIRALLYIKYNQINGWKSTMLISHTLCKILTERKYTFEHKMSLSCIHVRIKAVETSVNSIVFGGTDFTACPVIKKVWHLPSMVLF